MSSKKEDFTNRALALLLREQGINADFEQRAGRKRIDVVTQVDGLRVALEAETGHHRKAQAIKDADARLKQKLTTAVFAVCYPTGVTEENLPDAELTWTLRTKDGEPITNWSTGGVAQLAQAVQQAPKSLSGADVAAQQLSEALDTAVARLTPAGREALAKALDLPATKGGAAGNRYQVAAKRGMLVIATAMLFHHRVQAYLPAEPPEGHDGNWPPFSAPACAEQEEVIAAHREAWRGILAVDYKPVFETGRTALAAIPADPDTGQGIRALAEAVAGISERMSGLRHDLLGRIFHRVLDTARYDGSFYTSTAAAALLATLSLREQGADWADPNAIASLRICDPACGTGTLLMAAAERIRDLRNETGQLDSEDEELLGLHLVEDVLLGLRRELDGDAHGSQHPRDALSQDSVQQDERAPHDAGRFRWGSILGEHQLPDRAGDAGRMALPSSAGGDRGTCPTAAASGPGDYEPPVHQGQSQARPVQQKG